MSDGDNAFTEEALREKLERRFGKGLKEWQPAYRKAWWDRQRVQDLAIKLARELPKPYQRMLWEVRFKGGTIGLGHQRPLQAYL